ncbi:MAG: alpha/beta fold hydrolase [Deltaproteobacteria bacterium]|nr:alpha/beta fold hydrolase [Deltaproteobacteria bacterium]
MTFTTLANSTPQQPLEIPAEGPFDEESAEAAPVLGINLGGPLPPLFLVQTWDELSKYQRLAMHLGPDQPVYCVSPPSGETLDDFPSTVDAWSDLVLERLLSIGYEGPYLLGGWSLGGVIALEAAEMLEARGHSVRLVAMLDTRLPKVHPKTLKGRRKTTKLFKIARRLNEYALLETRGQKNAYIRKRLRRRFQKLFGKLRKQRDRLLGRQVPAQHQVIVEDQAVVTPGGRRMPLIKRAIYVVYLKYQKHESSIPVAQFWCRDSLKGALGDASLGWARYLRGDLEIVRLPATHFTMFDEPHVSFLAERLARSLERARK